jgi:predicted P-loop ATPase
MKIQEIAKLIGIEIGCPMPDETTWDLLDRMPDKKTITDDGREIITKKGKPLSHITNVHTVLETDPHYSDAFKYNILKDEVIINGETLEGHHITKACLFMQSVYEIRVGKDAMRDLMVLRAKANTFNPLQDYLNGLKWDGVCRIETLLPDYWGTDDTPLIREIGMRWAISCIARAMSPGAKVDTVLILSGPQGALKSSSLQALASEEFFSDSHLDISNKSAYELIHQSGVWIWEIAENYTLEKSDINNSKMFLSGRVDRYRPSYEQCPIKRGRSLVFASTTNAWQMLTDNTGNRRFWPVRVGDIDLNAIERDRDMIWAEALQMYNDGEIWWLAGAFEYDLRKYQEEFVLDDPWQAAVESVAQEYPNGFCNADVLDRLQIPQGRRGRKDSNRINDICLSLGYVESRPMLLPHRPEINRPRVWRLAE